MKSEVKNLCDKINNELKKAPTSTTLLSLIENLNAKAIKQLILNASNISKHKPNDPSYYSEFIYAVSTILKLSDTITLRDIVNTLNKDRINLLEKILDKHKKAMILYDFIKIRDTLIKQNNIESDEFNIYNLNDKLDNICNAYVSDTEYYTHTSPIKWDDLNTVTTNPIFTLPPISEYWIGRNDKFKKIFDNIDNIIKRI